MLNILGRPQRVCSGWTRRQILQAGGAGLLGLSLPKLLAAEATGSVKPARAKSVIFLFLFGGPSQLETFDLKPDAPSSIRGPFRPISSRTPEMKICELMPKLAAISDKYCVIRTMTHPTTTIARPGITFRRAGPGACRSAADSTRPKKIGPCTARWPTISTSDRRADRRAICPVASICPAAWAILQTYSTKFEAGAVRRLAGREELRSAGHRDRQAQRTTTRSTVLATMMSSTSGSLAGEV